MSPWLREYLLSSLKICTALSKDIARSLCSNLINDYDSISFLFLCPRLESLVLLGNPVAEEPEYREIGFVPSYVRG